MTIIGSPFQEDIMRKLSLLLILICGCSGPESDAPATDTAAGIPAKLSIPGKLQDKSIGEASGLAASQRRPDVLWTHNDSGAKAHLYAIDLTGRSLGRAKLKDAQNFDWEDIASFTLDDVPYLLIADVGDNDTRREYVSLYVVVEPDLDIDAKPELSPAWRIDFTYPGGPRDVESVAVDSENEQVLLLTKRTVPAELYAVPLRPESAEPVEAILLGKIGSLPQPTRQDIEFAVKLEDWHWQPTGMDIAANGSAIAIVTYRPAIYLFRRDGDWLSTLQKPPLRYPLRLRKPESIAFGADSKSLFVTNEKKHAALLRVDFELGRIPDVTIMTFNVQNLFDNVDDAGKDDKAYLPIEAKQNDAHIRECNEIEVASWRDECLHLDWSDAAIDFKLRVLAATIQQIDGGRGPDIIAFQEVENAAILDRLSTEYLIDSGYLPAVLVEGQDLRGIDVAFLSRLPLVTPAKLHALRFDEHPEREKDTRGVLEATFELPDGSRLTGFSVHFPAPFHPTEMRIAAYQHLAELRAQLPDENYAFAAGDFNTTSTEDGQQGMLDRFAQPHWTVAHDLGCGECTGTHYYARDDTWSFLDMILWSPARGAKATWQIRANSVHVANKTAAQVARAGTPLRHNSVAKQGVSDHWPLVLSIEAIENQ